MFRLGTTVLLPGRVLLRRPDKANSFHEVYWPRRSRRGLFLCFRRAFKFDLITIRIVEVDGGAVAFRPIAARDLTQS
jgi:hypothetical protein